MECPRNPYFEIPFANVKTLKCTGIDAIPFVPRALVDEWLRVLKFLIWSCFASCVQMEHTGRRINVGGTCEDGPAAVVADVGHPSWYVIVACEYQRGSMTVRFDADFVD